MFICFVGVAGVEEVVTCRNAVAEKSQYYGGGLVGICQPLYIFYAAKAKDKFGQYIEPLI